jgi:WD40 repeat protein
MAVLRVCAALLWTILFVVSVSAQETETPEPDLIYVIAVAWGHDGSKIAAVGIRQPSTQGYLRVIDVQTGAVVFQLDPSPGGFTSVAWSPDDRFIAAGGYDQAIWVSDVEARSYVGPLWGHRATVTDVDWNSGGTQLVSSGNWDGLTILWDMTAYEQIREVEAVNSFPFSVAFSPDDQQIAVGGEGSIRIYPSNPDLGGNSAPNYRVSAGALAWSHDGERLAFGAQVFQSVTNPNRTIFAPIYITDRNGAELSRFISENEAIYDIVWSADDTRLATSSIDGYVSVWEADSGTLLDKFNSGMIRYASDISFSPYGGQLAYGGTIPGYRVNSADTPPIQDGIKSLAGGAIQIAVPAPSIEWLQKILEICNLPTSIRDQLMSKTLSGDLAGFISEVRALSARQIASGCAADLIAVAEAL